MEERSLETFIRNTQKKLLDPLGDLTTEEAENLIQCLHRFSGQRENYLLNVAVTKLGDSDSNMNVIQAILDNGAHSASVMGNSPLHMLIRENKDVNKIDVVNKIIDLIIENNRINHNIDLNLPNPEGPTALDILTEKGDIQGVQKLLNSGAHLNINNSQGYTVRQNIDLNLQNPEGRTALDILAEKGNIQGVQKLLNGGAYLNIYTNQGFTALHIAAQHGHWEIVKILADHVIERILEDGTIVKEKAINLLTLDKTTALYLACSFNQKNVIDALLEHADLKDIPNNEGFTALQKAVSDGNIEIVTKLLKHNGVDIDYTMKGVSALHFALQNGSDNIAKILLDNGATFYPNMVNGETLLHNAVSNENSKIIKIITDLEIENKSDYVNLKNDKGLTALHLACQCNNVNIVDTLLKAGALIETSSEQEYSILHYAAAKSNFKIIKTLLAHKVDGKSVDISLLGPDKATSLHMVTSNDDMVRVGQALLEYNAIQGKKEYVNLQVKSGHTALHYAASNGHAKFAEILLKHGANIDIQDQDGDTPLLNAAEQNHPEIIRIITGHKANGKTLDLNHHVNSKTGYTALHWAVKKGHINLTKLLLALGADVNTVAQDKSTPLSLGKESNFEIQFFLNQSCTAGSKHSADEAEFSNKIFCSNPINAQDIIETHHNIGDYNENFIDWI